MTRMRTMLGNLEKISEFENEQRGKLKIHELHLFGIVGEDMNYSYNHKILEFDNAQTNIVQNNELKSFQIFEESKKESDSHEKLIFPS